VSHFGHILASSAKNWGSGDLIPRLIESSTAGKSFFESRWITGADKTDVGFRVIPLRVWSTSWNEPNIPGVKSCHWPSKYMESTPSKT
jgi:hypothetical protein